MSFFNRYAVKILTVGFSVLTLSGCFRFGNRVERAAETETIAGYYNTQPAELSVCVQKGVAETCVPANVGETPRELTDLITNPVAVLSSDDESVWAFMSTAPGQEAYLQTFVFPDKSIEYSGNIGEGQPVQYSGWLPAEYSNCSVTSSTMQVGRLTDEGAGTIMYDVPMKGRLELDIEVRREFVGDGCADTLELLRSCYGDHTKCLGTGDPQNLARQAEVASVFQFFIESTVIDPTEISEVSARIYRVKFR